MPRGKTQTPKAASDQAYGEKGAAIEAQKAIPLPDNTVQPDAMPVPANQPNPPTPGFDEALLAAQQEGPLPAPLSAPSESSEHVMTPANRPVTPNQVETETLTQMMINTNNPSFRAMTERLMMTRRGGGLTPSATRFSTTRRGRRAGNQESS